MGIVPLSLEFLNRHIDQVGGLKNCHMLELGNQQMFCHPVIAEGSAAKDWFTSQGAAEHVSIDLNGQLGSVIMDLSVMINRPSWLLHFDVVTDFGTSEHVGQSLEALYCCRFNCHNFCRPGGLLLFMNPKTGQWPQHGCHYFTTRHYEQLAKACNYKLLEVSEHPTLGNVETGWQIHAAMLRSSKPFISFEAFAKLCQGTVFAS